MVDKCWRFAATGTVEIAHGAPFLFSANGGHVCSTGWVDVASWGAQHFAPPWRIARSASVCVLPSRSSIHKKPGEPFWDEPCARGPALFAFSLPMELSAFSYFDLIFLSRPDRVVVDIPLTPLESAPITAVCSAYIWMPFAWADLMQRGGACRAGAVWSKAFRISATVGHWFDPVTRYFDALVFFFPFFLFLNLNNSSLGRPYRFRRRISLKRGALRHTAHSGELKVALLENKWPKSIQLQCDSACVDSLERADFSLFFFGGGGGGRHATLSPSPRSMKVGKAAIIIRFSTARWSIVRAAVSGGRRRAHSRESSGC